MSTLDALMEDEDDEAARKEALQAYMDQISKPLNTALNTLARERPAEPLKALAKLLDPEPAPSTKEELYAPSAALCGLMGNHSGRPITTDNIIEMLVVEGALSKVELATCDRPGKRAPRDSLAVFAGMQAEKAKSFAKLDKGARARALWQKALKPALERSRSSDNAWAAFEIHKRPTELMKRWDYDAGTDKWLCSETLIKMEGDPFAAGAMRECYRMKKMSQVNAQFFFHARWDQCNNYVAKRYMREAVEAQVYFDDVKMQMVSKRYARLYNALSPPKGVDFLQAFVMEVDRNGESMVFAVERAMEEEGAFIKYNSNSGFVDWDSEGHEHRLTPHAFTRFTFDRSAGELMVVDIQGCDDVYTDPQIHTLEGTEYGEGNLGVGGMALFFSTSHYDSLCERLGLLRFSLSPAEEARIEQHAGQPSPALKPKSDAPFPVDLSDAPDHSLPESMAAVATASKRNLLSRPMSLPVTGNEHLVEAMLPATGGGILPGEAAQKTWESRLKRRGSIGENQVLNALHDKPKFLASHKSLSKAAGKDADLNAEAFVKQAEQRIKARRGSLVGVAAKVMVTNALAARAKELRAERGSERESNTGTDEPSSPPTKATEPDGEYMMDEVPIKALPLSLLGLDDAAACARKANWLPEIPPPKPPRHGAELHPEAAVAFAGSGGTEIGRASPLAIGLVHAKLCEYALVGRLPLQEGEADVSSAGHHLVCAAAVGEARALRDMRSLCRGLPASEVLVGVKMREAEVPMIAHLLPALTARLAAAGDVSSMLEMANEANTGKEDGIGWLRAAVSKFDAASNDEKMTLSQYGCAKHQLLQKLAEMLVDAGKRAEASEAYMEASEAAMEAGKAKIAMKLSAKAEEFAEEDEEDEGE